MLRDVSKLSMATELFGQTLSMPVVLSPVGLAGMYARRGEAQAARAAKAAGVPFSLSTVGVCTVEEVAKAAAPPWFQLYMIRDRGFMAEVLAERASAGCPVLLFTVDLPMPGARYRDARNGMIADDRRRSACARRWTASPTRRGCWDVQLQRRAAHAGQPSPARPTDLKRLVEFWTWIGRNFDPVGHLGRHRLGARALEGPDRAQGRAGRRRRARGGALRRRRDRGLQPRRAPARRRALVDRRPAGDRRGGGRPT